MAIVKEKELYFYKMEVSKKESTLIMISFLI